MSLAMEAMPDDPKMQAFLYGPLVLAGDLGTEGLTERNTIGPNNPAVQRNPIEVPAFKACEGVDSTGWPAAGVPDDGSGERCDSGAAEQHFRETLLGVLAGFVARTSAVPAGPAYGCNCWVFRRGPLR